MDILLGVKIAIKKIIKFITLKRKDGKILKRDMVFLKNSTKIWKKSKKDYALHADKSQKTEGRMGLLLLTIATSLAQ